jgi:zinc D-Ala-D-Ala carboxypeptidase
MTIDSTDSEGNQLDTTARDLAQQILENNSITLATTHISGVNDSATARQNIIDMADGQSASRSSYGNAPGGTVTLKINLLQMILNLAQTYSYAI